MLGNFKRQCESVEEGNNIGH